MADKEAADRRVVVKRAVEEAAVKAVADEEVTSKTTDEAAGAVGDSSALGQAPSVAGTKRVAAPSGSTPPAKCPYRGVWKTRFV
jgi:ssDNA-binding replication factor A large subunit